jgi:uncharacterized protein YdeI (BOF family)
MIHRLYSGKKFWRYGSYAMLAAILVGYSVAPVFAETISDNNAPGRDASGATANTGTNIHTGRTADSYVEGEYGYVTISGTVSKILDSDRFVLDYGNGVTQVDCDDALHELLKKSDRKIKTGDKVTVSGKIDNEWFTKREILVSSILYIADDYILLYKIPVANTGAVIPAVVGVAKPSLFLDNQVALTGIVSKTNDNGSFTMLYKDGTIRVDDSGIKIPDDNRIASGDVVTVYGKIDNSFFQSQSITAETVEKIGLYSRESASR